jgi:hypothetical protein
MIKTGITGGKILTAAESLFSTTFAIPDPKIRRVFDRLLWVNSSPSRLYQPNGCFREYSGHSSAIFREQNSE